MNSMPGLVSIVGRPNVGKSSLFNRLVGTDRSLVHPEGGTTRDRIEAVCADGNRRARLVDTGGVIPAEKETLQKQVREQVRRAISESALLLFVVDARTGLVPLDSEIAALLRKTSKPVLLVANKADTPTLQAGAVDFYPLGFGEPIPVSCTQRSGFPDLKKRLFESFQGAPEEEPAPSLRIAVVGRPNVGKSSFLNALLKDERVIVDVAPGTTRDPVDVPFQKEGRSYLLIDTAGIRRFSKIKDEILFRSIRTSGEMIRRSDVCLFLIDGTCGIQKEDFQILKLIVTEGRGVVLVVNKWDLVKDVSPRKAEPMLRKRLGNLNIMPVFFTSALTGQNVLRAFEAVDKVKAHHTLRLETSRLNRFLESIRKNRTLPGGSPKLRYLVQAGTAPPRFLVFGSRPPSPPFFQYLERRLREEFDLSGTPVQLTFREEKRQRG